MSTRLDKTIMAVLLAAIALTALAHGAVEPWSVLLFKLIVIALILLWSIKAISAGALELTIPPTALPIAALLIVGVVQSLAITDSGGQRLSLSADVESTREAVTLLLFLFATFLIAANFFTDRHRLRALANFLIIYGFAMAVFAILQDLTWDGRFYWVRLNTQSASPFGPFTHHGHFAGYMAMLVPLSIALTIAPGVRGETRLFYGFAATVMGMATVMSLSRGGMISLAAGITFVAVTRAFSRKERERRKLESRGGKASTLFPNTHSPMLVVLIAVAIIGGVVWIGRDAVIDRITKSSLASSNPETETFFTNRGWIWQDTLAVIRANPVIGVGLGAFETAYPTYRASDGFMLAGEAHNDYLQIVADCGILGGLLALWFIAAILRAVGRGVNARDPMLAGIALGGGGGIFAILVHSLLDFNLQIPSNALLFLVLSAAVSHVGAAAARSKTLAAQQRAAVISTAA